MSDATKTTNGSPAVTRTPIDVFRYHDYRAFLSDYYGARKRRKGFSYRAFSKAVGLGAPNYLKLVIAGERNLTPEMAERFGAACGLGREAREYFVVLVAFNQAKGVEEKRELYERLTRFRRYRRAQRLELAEAAYHSTWYLPALRELALCEHFREDSEWLARTLWPAIKPAEAERAIQLLLELGLLERNEDGKLVPKARVVSTGPQTTGMHITNYHVEMMTRAAASIQHVPAASRDISSLTLVTSPEGLSLLKERIQAFRRELVELCESLPNASQVVQVNLQLFPLTHDAANASLAPSSSGPTRRKGRS